MLAVDHPLRTLKQELELHQQCEEVRLKLLNEDNVAVYLRLSLANYRTEQFGGLAHAIYQRSDGNPLFMINILDYLKAQGLQLDASKIETPRNIREMIERNLERLTPDQQRVLQAASVAGVQFSAAAIAAIDESCRELARKEQFI
jgi:predicted ATPase